MNSSEIQRRRDEHFVLAGKRKAIIEKMMDSFTNGDRGALLSALDEMEALEPSVCEHDRDTSFGCIACDEIHKEVFPEYYIVCSMCRKFCNKEDAHLHQGEYIGDECCWDERLRTTE